MYWSIKWKLIEAVEWIEAMHINELNDNSDYNALQLHRLLYWLLYNGNLNLINDLFTSIPWIVATNIQI